MGIVFRQSVKSTLVIFFGALLGAVTLLLSARYLTRQEMGFNRTILFQAVVASQFTVMGMASVISILIHKYPIGDKRRAALIGICISTPVVLTTLGSGFYFLFKQQLIQLLYNVPSDKVYGERFFALLPVCTLLYSLMVVLEYYLNSRLKVAKSVFVREVILRVLNLALILLYIFDWIDFNWLMAGTVVVHIIPIIILLMLCKQAEGFSFTLNWSVFSKAEKRELWHFAWYHMLMGVTITLMGFVDSLMIVPLDKDGMQTAGVYAIAIFVMSILVIPYRAMSTASLADLTRAYESGDMGKLKNLFQRGAINILIAATAMSTIIIMNMPNAIKILGQDYGALLGVVPVLILGRWVDMASGLNNEVISISKYYKFNFRISVLLIGMMVLFLWLLIPKWGIYGAAWGATLALVIFNGCKLIFLWMKLRLQPFSKKSAGVVVAGIAAMASVYFIPYRLPPFFDVVMRTGIMMIIYLILLLLLKPSADLNEYLQNIRKTKRLF
jgi:O-antigen/teichoic acid export membrane protein